MTAKKEWSWLDRDFIAAIVSCMREGKSDDKVIKTLAKTYAPPLTKSMLGSGLNRENVQVIIREIAPDAQLLFRQRAARATDGTRAMQARLAWKRTAKEHPGQSVGAVQFGKRAKPLAKKPTRAPTEREAADSQAISDYLAGLQYRDDCRAGSK